MSPSAVLLLASLLCGPAAQDETPPADGKPVDVEAVATEQDVEQELTLEVGLSLDQGASDILGINTGMSYLRRTSLLEFILTGDFNYLENGGVVLQEYDAVNVTTDLFHRETWSPFGLASWEKDRRRKIDRRLQAGLGVKRLLHDTERAKYSLSLALIYEDEEYSVVENVSDAVIASLRWKSRTNFGIKSHLDVVTFYQVFTDDTSHYRLNTEVELETKVTEALSLSVSAIDLYDSSPRSPDVSENQLRVRVLLGYTFALGAAKE